MKKRLLVLGMVVVLVGVALLALVLPAAAAPRPYWGYSNARWVVYPGKYCVMTFDYRYYIPSGYTIAYNYDGTLSGRGIWTGDWDPDTRTWTNSWVYLVLGVPWQGLGSERVEIAAGDSFSIEVTLRDMEVHRVVANGGVYGNCATGEIIAWGDPFAASASS
jgi:hypothetical protein